VVQQLAAEREEIRNQLNKRIDELYDEISQVQRDRDERLIIAESDKQQVKLVHVCLLMRGLVYVIGKDLLRCC